MRMFKRMLAIVLCVTMIVSMAMVSMPVGAANAEKQKELFYLLANVNTYSQAIGGVINEYQTTDKFKLSTIYSGMDIGSDSKNFWQTLVFSDNSGAIERKNEDIYKVERKVLLDVLTSMDPDIKLDDTGTAEQLKRIQKTIDKLTSIGGLELYLQRIITENEEDAFKDALNHVLPEMKSLFPNVDNETWGKLVKDWNVIDVAGAAIEGGGNRKTVLCSCYNGCRTRIY